MEDHILLNKRVMFAFEQCLLCLGHFPNIWYTAASHLQECGRILAEKGVKQYLKPIRMTSRMIPNLKLKIIFLIFIIISYKQGKKIMNFCQNTKLPKKLFIKFGIMLLDTDLFKNFLRIGFILISDILITCSFSCFYISFVDIIVILRNSVPPV